MRAPFKENGRYLVPWLTKLGFVPLKKSRDAEYSVPAVTNPDSTPWGQNLKTVQKITEL